MTDQEARMALADDDEDMAAVGRAFMEAIEQARDADPWMKAWAPAQCPSEIIFDLLNREALRSSSSSSSSSSSQAGSEPVAQPSAVAVAWQYRFKHGAWTKWLQGDEPIEEYKRRNRQSIEKGNTELRLLYLAPPVPAAEPVTPHPARPDVREALEPLSLKLWQKLCHECYVVEPEKCDCLDDIKDAFLEVINLASTSTEQVPATAPVDATSAPGGSARRNPAAHPARETGR